MNTRALSIRVERCTNASEDYLYLLPVEAQRLEDLANQVVADTVASYDRFRFIEKRVVDPRTWKDVGHRDNLIVYRERSGSRPTYPSIRSMDGSLQLIPCRSAPSVKIVGMLQGTLDDEMYGCFVDSDDAVKIRSMYLNDTAKEFHWLATIAGPTEANPFRFCGVARCTLGVSLPLAKKRGVCVVVSMGMTTTKHGERMTYYVSHSVNFADSAGDDTNIRAKCSLCWLKTELPNGKVELYMKGFAAPMGIVPEFAAFPVLVNCVLGIAMTSDAAYSKKLAWMIYDTGRTENGSAVPPMDACIGRCKNAFGGPKNSGSFRRCLVCRKAICSTCQIVRNIVVDIEKGQVITKKCSVCILCMHQAKYYSPLTFARRDVRLKRWKTLDVTRLSVTSSSGHDVVLTELSDRLFYQTR
uniref:FYVE-type domain-containing protein n=1 Tax=Peronospora matthiolae TaxID=2874970 RepID=A0AAV1TIE0_9STRA